MVDTVRLTAAVTHLTAAASSMALAASQLTLAADGACPVTAAMIDADRVSGPVVDIDLLTTYLATLPPPETPPDEEPPPSDNPRDIFHPRNPNPLP